MTAAELVDMLATRGFKTRSVGGDKWKCECPVHEDRDPSLSIRQLGELVGVRCFAGCDRLDVLRAIDPQLRLRDLGTRPRNGAPAAWKPARARARRLRAARRDVDDVLDAFAAAGLTWRAATAVGTWRAECPVCRDPYLSVWIIDFSDDPERFGPEPVGVTCAHGCDEDRIVAGLQYMRRYVMGEGQ